MTWLFVDFDGTLVDSLEVARSVYDRFVITCGGQPREDEFTSLNGPSLAEIVDRIATRLSLSRARSELVSTYSELWMRSYAAVEPKPGASGLLKEAQARKIKVAIVTSARSPFVETYIRAKGWNAFIEFTVAGDAVERSKPDPGIYLRALECAGARADESTALEDSINGVVAAVGAGIRTIGLADGAAYAATPEQLRLAGATSIIERLDQFFTEVDT